MIYLQYTGHFMEYMGLLKVVNEGPEGPGTEIFFINFGGLNFWGSLWTC